MGWPYEFLTLNEEEKHLRRIALNHYASIAHYSAFGPALVYLAFRLVSRVRQARRGNYQEVPNSPAVKAGKLGWAADLARRWRLFCWWLGEDVYFFNTLWGQRDEWVVGLVWTGWLLSLCVVGTGRDYLHLTKRFGAIATSQMPIQYFLALKYLNPFAYVFRTSHEQINRYHRVLGRIIYFLLFVHVILYNVFFFESGIWLKRFFAPIVFAGVVAFVSLHALNSTAMAPVRELSYRVFFITHLACAFIIPPLIYIHAPSERFYVIEALVLFVLDLASRKITTVTAPTTIEAIPGTNLIKISAELREKTIAKYKANPGSHIYMNIPSGARPVNPSSSLSGYLFEFLYSPFTVASVDEASGELTLVARKRSGPLTTHLADLASNPTDDNKVPLCIEGPYGAVGKVFSELTGPGAGRILLVAGGVGATFAIPIYHAILEERPASRVQLVWAIRSAGDATWATSSASGKSVIDDGGVQLFLTGDMGMSSDPEHLDGQELRTLSRENTQSPNQNKKRPNFERIVDDTFRHSSQETVAVLVCGPAEMARELRNAITPWVKKGRKVWWHNESFGW